MGVYDKHKLCIGILAIQGGFQEHEIALQKCSKQDTFANSVELKVIRVTDVGHLNVVDGLVIPGGESTSVRRILNDNLLDGLSEWAKDDRHVVFGTCAGLILLSKNIENSVKVDDRLAKLGIMDITTNRNFFGRQLNSFEGCVVIKEKTMLDENIKSSKVAPEVCSGVFIRAPAVVSVDGPSVQTLATVQLQEKEVIVGVQDKNCIALAFHPELSEDLQWHAYFLKLVMKRKLNC